MKITVFWDVEPCGLIEVVTASIITAIISLMLEAASTSETSVNFY
jgi:hypothetical protein